MQLCNPKHLLADYSWLCRASRLFRQMRWERDREKKNLRQFGALRVWSKLSQTQSMSQNTELCAEFVRIGYYCPCLLEQIGHICFRRCQWYPYCIWFTKNPLRPLDSLAGWMLAKVDRLVHLRANVLGDCGSTRDRTPLAHDNIINFYCN